MHRVYDVYIKGKNPGDEKRLIYYTMEEERWKVTDIWPPEGTQMQRWYCDEGNRLSPDKPSVEEGADRYKVDFTVQSSDCNRWWEMAVLEEKAVSYPDRATVDEKLLTYTSPPLDEDLEITGYPVANLFVRSTETDGAFYVYLEAVNPDGRVFYLTEGLLRAIHRSVSSDPSPYRLQVPHHSYREADAQPLVPGEVAELSFGLQPTSVLVRRRWRLRIAIAGHDEGAFVRIPTEGSPVITVERNQVRASCIDLPVVRRHG
jgi:putative CocE/NonD family hydrolase